MNCDLTLTLILSGIVIATAVCGVMLYSIARFRATHLTTPANFMRHSATEVLWASIPILILAGAAAPTVIKVLVAASAVCLAAPQGM